MSSTSGKERDHHAVFARKKKKTTKANRKKKKKKTSRPSNTSPESLLFPALGSESVPGGLGAAMILVEGVDSKWQAETQIKDATNAKKGGSIPFETQRVQAGKKITQRLAPDEIAGVFAALSHPMRLEILFKLLEGPQVYKSLQKLTGLKPGPLYHHINELRLAGLVAPRQRDLYELNQTGRKLVLIASLVPGAIKSRKATRRGAGKSS